MKLFYSILTILVLFCSCKEDQDDPLNVFRLESASLDGRTLTEQTSVIRSNSVITLRFNQAVEKTSFENAVQFIDQSSSLKMPLHVSLLDNDHTIQIQPTALTSFSQYKLVVDKTAQSFDGVNIISPLNYTFRTALDSTDKFERISTDELLTKVQQQTFKYFWDHAHASYGMIRERNSSGETVTTGGTGFGVMAILTGIERNFITREQGLERTKKIVSFLKMADKYHGAFAHWYNGSTGKTQPFSEKDNGADLVETALLFQGLLTARTYFNDAALTADISTLYNAVEWSFFQNGQQALLWHWSPNFQWEINLKISGWNESLIVYILAAGSPTHGIDASVYEQGWANNGNMRNGNTYHGIQLPLGPAGGGPLFLSQYSFLGLNPNGLQDQYASYEQQVKNHSLINRAYCIANPQGFSGYSADCWGLTASDDINGYRVHSPTEDNGVITPTAALSSIPYSTAESLQALEFFYYKLGDKIWGEYGFKDAFSLHEPWFADSYLAIDQGPIIIGIENHRSGLLWKNFMQTPEIKSALQKLKFTSPNL